jgi:hypothetical protein
LLFHTIVCVAHIMGEDKLIVVILAVRGHRFVPALFVASFAVCLPSNPTKHPRYTLLLPDGSLGWVPVIVNDPKR